MSGRPAARFRLLLAAALVLGCAGPKPERGARGSIDSAASPEALVALADSAVAAAEPDLARRALTRAAEIDPRSPAVRLGYGRYYTAILRYKDAKTEFDRAAALDPASPEPHFWLGVAYLKAGEKAQAIGAFDRALRLDPKHAATRERVRPLLEERYRSAGIPGEYASLPERPTVSRGEVGVMLAVELGVDPDRPAWRSDAAHRSDWPAIDRAWGERWLRAAAARGWILPMADRDLHLDDPLTRGAFALLLAEIMARSATGRTQEKAGTEAPATAALPDLGPRHYLGRAASEATRLGLPLREGGRFEAQALVTGLEALRAVRGLARSMGAAPAVSWEPSPLDLVK